MEASPVSKMDKYRLSRLDSFNQTYAALHQAIYANIFKIVQNHTCAEDLLQEVFITFWEHMERLEPERIPNWLFVVSFNKSISYIKRSARIDTATFPKHLDPVEDIAEIDENEFEELILKVYDAIESLPEKKRQVFRQHRLEGKKLEQIATEMDLSINTVKDHLKIANKLIRKNLVRGTYLKAGTELALLFALTAY